MFQPVDDAAFLAGEHDMLRFWEEREIFRKRRELNASGPVWSFLDGPITANNPMGVHHAWGRTYKDAFQRYHAMQGEHLRYQNGFDCQGLWVEVEVEREFGFGTKAAIEEHGIDKFVNECKKRVLTFAARQTEQSIRLGYWMDWDDPEQLRLLAEHLGDDQQVTITTPSGKTETGPAHLLVARLGNPEWGGSYFTFSTENNETIWSFLKKCYDRGKVYRGHDVMPWGGKAGSAYSQMEVVDGRKLTTHRSVFVRFPLLDEAGVDTTGEHLLVWTTTPWTLTSNVAAAVNVDLDYVKIKANKDDAVYYFAKENLNFQRLANEFKDGFDGKPWPNGVPKLKTLAQIFKEQGGFEELGTVKGSELVGRRYRGPFDELDAQQAPGGFPPSKNQTDEERKTLPSGVECHRVIDGGRNSKGGANVVAGEGTGIVHIAPGCGDVDHKIGEELGLVSIAPLGQDGRFMDGFGAFTGREAIDPDTPELVFSSLKEKKLLVAVETYPHIYPHCWRTGEELVFRLVDEWLINMDWREDIKDVTRQIDWLPDEINGQEREVEWLTNMRDWMISKKRFWGLALPIWVDAETDDFEVIGSLEELQERAVEGWDDFEGNTPHRPWIDRVKIQNPKTGNLMTRVPDVGNPWLDAGIVPFSTLGYNTDRDGMWSTWYPADMVTECFPGQFRNWFYSLLSMATMMDGTPPFKTLLGHRLVMDEKGNAMHKSDGTAIWFEEAAEQLGVDTLRWMYLAQNPAQDLRFGLRDKDQPVTLTTPDGETDTTREGVQTCLVTSTPADEVRRQILIPLWNSYAFFVNYARLDGFDPNSEPVPIADRPEIDRWLLSNLQQLVSEARAGFDAFDTPRVTRAAAAFVDDLSNWYIRRNRRRFWSKRGEGDPSDKQAAYQTLHHVLITLCKVLAPCIPFLTERMYQNLVCSFEDAGPESVHLCDYPEVNAALVDADLNHRMASAQKIVRVGHRLRDDLGQKVRQPLAELRFATADDDEAKAVESLAEVIADELNVKAVTRHESLGELVRYTYKPNLKTLGPKYGKLLGVIRKELPDLPDEQLAPLRNGESITLTLGGEELAFEPDDVMVATEQSSDWAAGDADGVQVALSGILDDELRAEGVARDFVRQVQQARKETGLAIEDRITIDYATESSVISDAIKTWAEYVRTETQADSIEQSDAAPESASEVPVGDGCVSLVVTKV